jgi:hypothetical protein
MRGPREAVTSRWADSLKEQSRGERGVQAGCEASGTKPCHGARVARQEEARGGASRMTADRLAGGLPVRSTTGAGVQPKPSSLPNPAKKIFSFRTVSQTAPFLL